MKILYYNEFILNVDRYDIVNQPVLDPVTIAHLCVCPENQEATEYDYKKALNLSQYVQDSEERNDLVLHIWCSAILRDNTWKGPIGSVESPVEILRDTMFYMLTDLAITLGNYNYLYTEI